MSLYLKKFYVVPSKLISCSLARLPITKEVVSIPSWGTGGGKNGSEVFK